MLQLTPFPFLFLPSFTSHALAGLYTSEGLEITLMQSCVLTTSVHHSHSSVGGGGGGAPRT
jgi:hypothetical protein